MSAEKRVRKYTSLILDACDIYKNVPPSIMAGMIENESSGYPGATRYECCRKDAKGKCIKGTNFGGKYPCPKGTQRFDAKGRPLMSRGPVQFLIGTGERYGLRSTENPKTDERADPEKSIPAAAHYLSDLIARFNSIEYGLAAYNAGEGGVSKSLKKYGRVPNPKYVKHVLDKAEKYKDLDTHNR